MWGKGREGYQMLCIWLWSILSRQEADRDLGANRKTENLGSCSIFTKCLFCSRSYTGHRRYKDEPDRPLALEGFKVRCQGWLHQQITPQRSVRNVQGMLGLQEGGISSSQSVKKGFIDNNALMITIHWVFVMCISYLGLPEQIATNCVA